MESRPVYWPLDMLNRLMARLGIKPELNLIYHEVTEGVSSFRMRVTCPISPGGPILSADGPQSSSKQRAKHAAALAFMEKYLDYKNNEKSPTIAHPAGPKIVVNAPTKQSANHRVPKVVCLENNLSNGRVETVDVPNVSHAQMPAVQANTTFTMSAVTPYSEELDMLKAICSKMNLGEPKVDDVCAAGSSRASLFTADCKVGGLCIEGEGKSISLARLNAIVKMIQLLTGTASVAKILKTSRVTVTKMRRLALESYQNEMVVSSHSGDGSQPQVQIDINDEESACVRMPENFREEPAVSTNPVVAEDRGELIHARKQAEDIGDGNNNSVSNMNCMHLTENYQNKRFPTKPNGRSYNNDTPDCVDVRVGSTTSNKFVRNVTRLQALSKISRTLGNLEKQLHEEILDALVYCDLPHRHSVEILSHNYDVFLHEKFDSPKIFEGNNECTDHSIRVACLTKVLMGLKRWVEINDHREFIR